MSEENKLITVRDMQTLATAIAKSNLLGIKTADQALTLMAIAQAEGLHPARAACDYHIIEGKPSLKSDAMLARFQASGGKINFKEYSDSKCIATFIHPQGGEITIEWDMKRAEQAGLIGKSNWKKYPRQMLRARVISEGIRTIFPGVLSGFYSKEEVEDFTSDEKKDYIDSTSIKIEEKQEPLYTKCNPKDNANLPFDMQGRTLELKPEERTDLPQGNLITDKQRKMIFALCNKQGIPDNEQRSYLESIVEHSIESSKNLTKAEASKIIENLQNFGAPKKEDSLTDLI